jgi:hypothetical protein
MFGVVDVLPDYQDSIECDTVVSTSQLWMCLPIE